MRTRPQSSHVPPASRSRPATSLHDVKLSFRKGLHTGQQRIPPSLGAFSSLPLKSLPQARHHGIGIFLPGPAASPLAGPFRCRIAATAPQQFIHPDDGRTLAGRGALIEATRHACPSTAAAPSGHRVERTHTYGACSTYMSTLTWLAQGSLTSS